MTATITVEKFFSTTANRDMWFAHGPAGHTHLISATTPEYAMSRGLEYFLATRALVDGKWVIAR